MPQLYVGNQAHPHDWDVASCSRKYKYDFNNKNLIIVIMPTDVLVVQYGILNFLSVQVSRVFVRCYHQGGIMYLLVRVEENLPIF